MDFLSGLVHWAEDNFGTKDTPIYGKWVVIPNTIHHEDSSVFTHNNCLQSSWDLTLASIIGAIIFYFCGILNWQLILLCFIGANSNQLHKYTHIPQQQVPWFIRILQKAHILQSARHHTKHHMGEKNTAYCVVTPYVNPILDKILFWRMLEKITVPIFGAPRREDIKQ